MANVRQSSGLKARGPAWTCECGVIMNNRKKMSCRACGLPRPLKPWDARPASTSPSPTAPKKVTLAENGGPKPKTCFVCGAEDHLSYECPIKKVLSPCETQGTPQKADKAAEKALLQAVKDTLGRLKMTFPAYITIGLADYVMSPDSATALVKLETIRKIKEEAEAKVQTTKDKVTIIKEPKDKDETALNNSEKEAQQVQEEAKIVITAYLRLWVEMTVLEHAAVDANRPALTKVLVDTSEQKAAASLFIKLQEESQGNIIIDSATKYEEYFAQTKEGTTSVTETDSAVNAVTDAQIGITERDSKTVVTLQQIPVTPPLTTTAQQPILTHDNAVAGMERQEQAWKEAAVAAAAAEKKAATGEHMKAGVAARHCAAPY